MVVVDRAYGGAAAKAVLQTAMTPTTPSGGGTIVVDDDSGYPTSGKFEIVIDRGLSNEESVLITSRSGATFTINQRGYDGTVASTHTSGSAFVEHELSARSVQLFVDHVDDIEADPHSTKLLNNTRHDIEARHTFGAAYGTPVTPTALTPDIAGSAGTGNNPAREDHVHNVPAAVPVAIGTALSEGAGTSFARDNHVHVVGVGAINASNMFAAGVVDITAIAAAARDIFSPPGAIVAYGAAAAPTGWLLCQGQAVSRTTFATLFGVIGTTYGAGDGSTTFNVPNLQQRFPLGKASAGTGSTLGGTGGTIDHVHALDTSSSYARVTIIAGSPGAERMQRKTTESWTPTVGHTPTAGADTTNSTTGAALGGDSDTANPPFQVVNFIIRTGNTS